MISHVESKKLNSENQKIEWWLPGAGGWEELGDVSQRVLTFIYVGSSENLMYKMVIRVNNIILHT